MTRISQSVEGIHHLDLFKVLCSDRVHDQHVAVLVADATAFLQDVDWVPHVVQRLGRRHEIDRPRRQRQSNAIPNHQGQLGVIPSRSEQHPVSQVYGQNDRSHLRKERDEMSRPGPYFDREGSRLDAGERNGIKGVEAATGTLCEGVGRFRELLLDRFAMRRGALIQPISPPPWSLR